MRYAIGICLLALVNCTMPGPDFKSVPATRIIIEGSVFDVRVQGRRAEAIRVNRQYAPRLGPIGERAAFAMARVSGCDVTRIKGDAAVVLGELACSENGIPLPKRSRSGMLDCYEIDRYSSPATGQDTASYDCDWFPE